MPRFFAPHRTWRYNNNLLNEHVLNILNRLPKTFYIFANILLNNTEGRQLGEIDWIVFPTNPKLSPIIIEDKIIPPHLFMTSKAKPGNQWEFHYYNNEGTPHIQKNGIDQLNASAELFRIQLILRSSQFFAQQHPPNTQFGFKRLLYIENRFPYPQDICPGEHCHLIQNPDELLPFIHEEDESNNFEWTPESIEKLAIHFGLSSKEIVNGVTIL